MIKKIILYIILFLSIIGVVYSSYHIVVWMIDNHKTSEQVEMVQEFVEESSTDSSLLSIDFTSLYQENEEAVGWIRVINTNINYPVLQHSDNSYYLNHSFDGSYNNAGWIFLDYRNQLDTMDYNTIIYGHGRVDGSMFGSLKNVLTNEWLSDSNNYKIILYLADVVYTYEIFSAYHIDTTEDYLLTNFSSESEYLSFLDLIKNRSSYSFPSTVSSSDKIITLSTCYNDREKMVVHGKLISEERK